MNNSREIIPFIKRFRRRVLFGMAGTCAFTLISAAPPLLIRSLVDKVIEPKVWHLLPLLAGSIILAYLLSALIRFSSSISIVGTTQRIVVLLRRRMYNHILRLGMRFHGENTGGMLVNKLMSDTGQIERLVSVETLHVLAEVVTFVFSLVVVFSISVQLSLVLCLMLLLDFASARYFSRRIQHAGESYRSQMDAISGRLQEILAGAKQVRIYNRESWETANFLERSTESLKKSFVASLNSVGLGIACTAISGFGSTAIIGLGAYMVLRNEITHGDLIAFNTYVWMAINPAISMATMAGHFAETFVSAERVGNILAENQAVKSAPGARNIQRGPGAVEFRNVTFHYSEDVPLFNKFNLQIRPGSTVALVGATGCGKTTLVSLLMRQWDVNDGAILIDGTDIKTVDLESLRKLFGVVLQHPVLFEGSFAENIAYGAPRASRAQVERAARLAEIHELAMSLPMGYDTIIGSKGISLSLGEKQRISIARAILKDPAILILDEATSALDSESEALIQKALAKALVGRTSIVVAHRLSTIVGADMIVTMSQGRIVELGTHEELMAIEDGLYRSLYSKLQGQEEPENE
jgi:ATP-binding cassette, subfamily B, bacterial MsbA